MVIYIVAVNRQASTVYTDLYIPILYKKIKCPKGAKRREYDIEFVKKAML
jgi:hypothetical protein